MKIVLDANIFISALHRGGNPLSVTQRAAQGLDTLFITDDIIKEIEGVLGRPKFKYGKDDVARRIATIEGFAKKVTVSPKYLATGACRDPKDDKILECAHAADADCIITGDFDLLDLKEYKGIRIITVKEYLDIVNPGSD